MLHINKQCMTTIKLIVLILLLNSFAMYWQHYNTRPSVDYFGFWTTAQAIKTSDIKNIYSDVGRQEVAQTLINVARHQKNPQRFQRAAEHNYKLYGNKIDVTGSPLLFSITSLISTGNYNTDEFVFMLSSFICFILAIFCLCRKLGLCYLTTALLLMFFCSYYMPTIAELHVANINQLQLLSIALYIMLSQSSKMINKLFAYILLGLAIILKPNLIFIALFACIYYTINRKWKNLGLLSGGIIIAAISSWTISIYALDNSSYWIDFIKSLPITMSFKYTLSGGNYGLAAIIKHFTNHDFSKILLIICLLAYISYEYCLSKKYQGQNCDRADIKNDAIPVNYRITALACATMLVSSGLVWMHYYVLLIPSLLITIRLLIDRFTVSNRISYKSIAIVIIVFSYSISSKFLFAFDDIRIAGIYSCGALISSAIIMHQQLKDSRKCLT